MTSDNASKSSPGWINTSTIGIVLLLGALVASLVRVVSVRKELEPSGKVVLRIAHWQLEGDHVLAIDTAIADYEKLHPNVHIIQNAVPESVYAQWLNTSLIGGSPPDIAELGMSRLVQNDQYTVRFFRSLGDVLALPNPYNAGTPMENAPWKETFVDGMRGGYSDTLQDYFKIPTTVFVWRLFYNKNLLREATGSDVPPKTFGELIAACEKIKKLGRPGKKIYPIVNANRIWLFFENFKVSFTAGLEPKLDTDLNGEITDVETYEGFVRKQWDMNSPEIREFYNCMKRLCEEFPEGFMGMDRQMAIYTFTQQGAAFITSGSWDVQSIEKFARGSFDVGVMEIPIPAKGEPWGNDVVGRATEAVTGGGVGYGVCKTSRHQKEAIDFLQFLTSQQRNGRYMAIAGWPPVIIGSPTSEAMKAFQPNPEGYLASIQFNLGPQVNSVFDGQVVRFLQGESGYDEFATKYEAVVVDPNVGGDKLWVSKFKEIGQQSRGQEQVLAVQSVRELMDPSATDAAEKYRRVLLQQVRKNNGRELKSRFEQARGKPMPIQ